MEIDMDKLYKYGEMIFWADVLRWWNIRWKF